MGIARGAIALLMEEAARRPFSGSVATLGKQAINTTPTELSALFVKFGLPPRLPIPAARGAIDDTFLLRALGFDTVHSFDYSNYENASFVVDLNAQELPPEHLEKYDVVLDSGTIEHVFHVPNALKNVFHLLRPGGRVLFLSPASNHMDHGFYSFSPTFFADYYTANGFSVETIYVVRYHVNPDKLWDVYAYKAGQWYDISIGGLDGRPYAIFFVGTKRDGATWNVVPQQGFYSDQSPHYKGSRLASSATAGARSEQEKADAEIAHGPNAAVNVDTTARTLRSVVRRIPGAAVAYRGVRKLLWTNTARVVLGAVRTRLLGKRLHGRF